VIQVVQNHLGLQSILELLVVRMGLYCQWPPAGLVGQDLHCHQQSQFLLADRELRVTLQSTNDTQLTAD